MGKKAVNYFFYNLMILGTVALLLLAAGGWRASFVNPAESDTYLFLGLMLPAILLLNLGALILWAVLRKWWALLPLAALLLNAGNIGALYRFRFGAEPETTPDLKVASYNIHGFRNGEYKEVVGKIAGLFREEKADVVCLQEYVPHSKFDLDSIRNVFSYLPHTVQRGSLLFLSRYPINGFRFFPFEKTDNSALLVEIDINGKPVNILSVHLQTTGVSSVQRSLRKEIDEGNLEGETAAVRQLRNNLSANAIIRAGQAAFLRRAADSLNTPVVICGDFNDTPASYTYRTMKGGMTDAFISNGRGYGATFRNIRNLLRIDYIFYNEGLTGLNYYSPDVDYSDHRPVIAGFGLK